MDEGKVRRDLTGKWRDEEAPTVTIVPRRRMLPLRTSRHLLQLVQKSALPQVSGPGPRPLAGGAPTGTPAHSLRTRGLHPSSSSGTLGFTEQEGCLRSAAPRQRPNLAGSRSPSPASGR